MSRLLFLIAIVVVIYLLIRSYRKNNLRQDSSKIVEDMVRCAHCGIHLPKGESVQANGRFFCSTAHRDVCGE